MTRHRQEGGHNSRVRCIVTRVVLFARLIPCSVSEITLRSIVYRVIVRDRNCFISYMEFQAITNIFLSCRGIAVLLRRHHYGGIWLG